MRQQHPHRDRLDRMPPGRQDIKQRAQDEGPLPEPWVREDRLAPAHRHLIAHREQVEVKFPRGVSAAAGAAERPFDRQQSAQNDRRCQPRPNQRDRVDKQRPKAAGPGPRAIERRQSPGTQPGPRQVPQRQRRPGCERTETRAPQISADADQHRIRLRDGHAPRSTTRAGHGRQAAPCTRDPPPRHAQLRSRITRACSRCHSRLRMSCRRSRVFRPRASASSALAVPVSLK